MFEMLSGVSEEVRQCGGCTDQGKPDQVSSQLLENSIITQWKDSGHWLLNRTELTRSTGEEKLR